MGREDRLDFTVVGPAVNEVSRIASMCRSVDRELLASADFCTGLDAAGRGYLVSTGRFALRGIGRAQDLYTLDPVIASDEVVAGGGERCFGGQSLHSDDEGGHEPPPKDGAVPARCPDAPRDV